MTCDDCGIRADDEDGRRNVSVVAEIVTSKETHEGVGIMDGTCAVCNGSITMDDSVDAKVFVSLAVFKRFDVLIVVVSKKISVVFAEWLTDCDPLKIDLDRKEDSDVKVVLAFERVSDEDFSPRDTLPSLSVDENLIVCWLLDWRTCEEYGAWLMLEVGDISIMVEVTNIDDEEDDARFTIKGSTITW